MNIYKQPEAEIIVIEIAESVCVDINLSGNNNTWDNWNWLD